MFFNPARENKARSRLPVISCCAEIISCFMLILTLLGYSQAAQSAESTEAGSASSYVKLEPMTVNLQNLSQYLQVTVTLKAANSQASETIKNLMPIIRHRLIVLLSEQKADDLASTQNKKKVMASIKYDLNNALNLDQKEGISSVLFESFIIQ
jgi:flagellar FliL protein